MAKLARPQAVWLQIDEKLPYMWARRSSIIGYARRWAVSFTVKMLLLKEDELFLCCTTIISLTSRPLLLGHI